MPKQLNGERISFSTKGTLIIRRTSLLVQWSRLRFYCRRCGFDPRSGSKKDPTWRVVWPRGFFFFLMDLYMQKKWNSTYTSHLTEIQFKMDLKYKSKTKTTNLLGKNMRKSSWSWLRKAFLAITPKAQSIKVKNNKLSFIKTQTVREHLRSSALDKDWSPEHRKDI